MLGTSTAHVDIRHAIESGRLSYTSTTLSEGERLDILAGKFYGDGKYWWILAAASGIGWGLQVPSGTIVYIPDLQSTLELVR